MITRIWSPDVPRRIAQLTSLIPKILIRLKTSTKRIADQILEDSLNLAPCVPVDTGALRSTGRVESIPNGHAIVYGGKSVSGFGPIGADFVIVGKTITYVDYASQVHDDLRPRNYQRPGSGPKFLETHAMRRMTESQVIISRDIQDLITETFD